MSGLRTQTTGDLCVEPSSLSQLTVMLVVAGHSDSLPGDKDNNTESEFMQWPPVSVSANL